MYGDRVTVKYRITVDVEVLVAGDVVSSVM